MEKFIYETHMHTSTSSACGKSLGSEYISYYKELGYAGIIITDHFFNGNCAVDRSLPWEEKIKRFCEGYKIAKAEGDRQGFDVFFGFEDNFGGDEYLIYGIDEEWLLAHPEMMEWDHVTHYQKIKEAGGLVVQAHPFRERDYIQSLNLHPYQADAWEVANAGNPTENDQLAFALAKKLGLKMTAGSDMHKVGQTSVGVPYGVSFPYKLNSIQDYVNGIKNGDNDIYVPTGNTTWTGDAKATLPIYFHDENGKASFVEDVYTLL